MPFAMCHWPLYSEPDPEIFTVFIFPFIWLDTGRGSICRATMTG